MAYSIDETCIKCGACAENCPVGAISEGSETYTITSDVCIDCGACADTCPCSAINAA